MSCYASECLVKHWSFAQALYMASVDRKRTELTLTIENFSQKTDLLVSLQESAFVTKVEFFFTTFRMKPRNQNRQFWFDLFCSLVLILALLPTALTKTE